MKKIAILGSTGSIGTQTLEVINNLNNQFKVVLLSGHKNVKLLFDQVKRFKPRYAVITNGESQRLKRLGKTKVYFGLKNLKKIIACTKIDLIVNALVGSCGILPTFWSVERNIDVALANKESLVSAGELIIKTAKRRKVNIFPIDSEHSAIWQCLLGERLSDVKQLILTCSGGPFLGKSRSELKKVTRTQALKHPTWQMGQKNTIDSATLMNKGLEVIEAYHLFGIDLDKIKVIIHPESIIHSMVEFCDGSIKAQLSPTDMRIPIQYALTYPNRSKGLAKNFDLVKLGKLTFKKPDKKTFPCLKLAYEALEASGTYPCVLNAANEVAVDLFLSKKIGFLDIPKLIEYALNQHKPILNPSLNQILEMDRVTRQMLWQSLNHQNF